MVCKCVIYTVEPFKWKRKGTMISEVSSFYALKVHIDGILCKVSWL